MKRWVDQGMSHQDIVDRVEQETGVRVGRSAVSAELSRAGLTRPAKYTEVLPWKIRVKHQNNYNQWMLRVHYKIKHNMPVRDGERERHLSWLQRLQQDDAVITYLPDTEYGFYRVKRKTDDTEVIRPPEDYEELLKST